MTVSSEQLDSTIERQSETPYYQQLSSVLTQRIEVGAIRVGDRLPSENQLCDEFGVSRATVRHALQYLESTGMVHRIANRGVFAGRRPGQHGWMIQNADGFLENAITHQNRSVTTTVLRSGYTILPDPACTELEVPAGTTGFELVRIRHLDGQPTVFSTNYLPPVVAGIVANSKETLNGTGGLSETLRRAGYPLAGANRFMKATMPTAEIASALSIARTDPLVQIRSTSWRPDGTRFDVYETYVRTDIVPLEVNVRSVIA